MRATPKRPSIVLVVVDSLRADRVGCLSPGRGLTPSLDRLAEESVCFTRAVTPAPWTKPAVSSLFTGLYPSAHGATTRGAFGARVAGVDDVAPADVMRPDVPTLAECLADRGYATAAFTGGGFTDRVYQGRGFAHFDGAGYRLSELSWRCAAWMASRSEGPFFVWIHAYDTHRPYRRPGLLSWLRRRSRPNSTNAAVRSINSGEIVLSEKEVAELGSLYDAAVVKMDQVLGSLLGAIEDSGGLDRCVLCVVSDHGEALYEHRLVEHADVPYNEVLHVPFLLRAPGLPPASVGQYVRLLDIMPTVLDLADSPIPRMQGQSLLPAVIGGLDLGLAAFSEVGTRRRARALQAWVCGSHYKLIEWVDEGRRSLYDLDADPGEACDLWGGKGEVDEQLSAWIQDQAKENAEWGSPPSSVPEGSGLGPGEDEKRVRRRLTDLGYLDRH